MVYRYKRRVSLRNKKILLILGILGVVLISILFINIQNQQKISIPLTGIKYKGAELKFRADLREASKIEIDEEKVREILFNPNVQSVWIGFIGRRDSSLYSVEAFEITFKLLNFSYPSYNMFPKFRPRYLETLEEAKEVRGNEGRVWIILVGPSISNTTKIKVEDYKIWIYGDSKEGLDLAVTRFLMAALGISV